MRLLLKNGYHIPGYSTGLTTSSTTEKTSSNDKDNSTLTYPLFNIDIRLNLLIIVTFSILIRRIKFNN
jgi:hypothetical protein